MYIAFILGRNPQLAKKEIEAAATILPLQWSLSIVQPDVLILKSKGGEYEVDFSDSWLQSPEIVELTGYLQKLQDRLGGTLKIAYLFEQISDDQLEVKIREYVKGKREFGISVYGKGVDPVKTGLLLKKEMKNNGHPCRFISPKEGMALSTAQVFRHHLTENNKSCEVVVIGKDEFFWIGLTVTVQDIDSYVKRDFQIPAPDPTSGMLSPKLAQIMLNLAQSDIVYDPFCGNGRLLLEAHLMGMTAYGSDIAEGKVKAARRNLAWLCKEYGLNLPQSPENLIWQQDARQAPQFPKSPEDFVIVTEPYLGKPLRRPLTPGTEASAWYEELEELYLGFFRFWSQVSQAARPAKMVVVFPRAILVGKSSLSLYGHLVDRLAEMGYSSLQVSDYGRPDALVNREIVEVSYI